MGSIHAETAVADPAMTVAMQPRKALVVIDGSERAGRVLAYALGLVRRPNGAEIVLLGVERRAPDERLRGYGSFKRDVIEPYLKEALRQRAVSAAARRLEQAGVAHKGRVEIGDPAETILRVAAEEGCDVIVIADAPAGAVHRWLPRVMGLAPATVALQVAALAGIPVTIIH